MQTRLLVLAASVCLVVGSVASFAQDQGRGNAGGRGRGQRGNAAPDPVKKAVQIKPNLWLIADGGANSVVEVTPEGLILADTKNPGAEIEAARIAEIKSISPMPVKYVFNNL